jgi:hypothetical protein
MNFKRLSRPRLENDFDAPPQTVNRQDLLETGQGGGDRGDENGPVHEFQDRLGRMVSHGLFFCPHAPEVGGFSVNRCRHETDAGARGVVEQHFQVEAALILEQILAVRIDGKAGEPAVGQIVGGLDSGVADVGLGVGNAGKIGKEMAGELDDRAVLDEHPALAAKERGRFGLGSPDLPAQDLFQKPLQQVVKGLVKAEVDRLPGWGAAGNSFNLGGQIVATWRSVNALLTEGGEQINHLNLSGRASGEIQVPGQLEQV